MGKLRLSTEKVRHIALLARVGMTDEEVERMRGQLSNILEHFDALQELDTEDFEATGHSADLESVMREDSVGESCRREDILANAPRREDDFIRVRAVLE